MVKKIKIEHMIDAGCSGRKNQDAFWVRKKMVDKMPVIMAIVCDGVGGLSDGEVASKQTVDYLIGSLWENLERFLEYQFSIEQLKEQLLIALKKINQSLYTQSKKVGKRTGTTVAFCLIYGSEYLIANVGDSRVYWHSKEGLYRTNDHIQQDGKKQSHVLWQSIGSQKEIKVDSYIGKIEGAMEFLLMSDGAYRSFQKKEIFEYCKKGNLRSMKRQAIKRREPDNMTAVRIQLL